jgi:hypothetical protein
MKISEFLTVMMIFFISSDSLNEMRGVVESDEFRFVLKANQNQKQKESKADEFSIGFDNEMFDNEVKCFRVFLRKKSTTSMEISDSSSRIPRL